LGRVAAGDLVQLDLGRDAGLHHELAQTQI
jgi:hypothetical protein